LLSNLLKASSCGTVCIPQLLDFWPTNGFVVGVSNLIEKPECGTNGMLNVTQVLASACVFWQPTLTFMAVYYWR